MFTQKTTLSLCLVLPVLISSMASAETQKPNIIFILADDLGWTDINCRELARSSNDPNQYVFKNNPNDPNIYATDPNGCQIDLTDAEEHDSLYYKTPNLAKLRENGIRFTHAYSACSVCMPSRAALLTGKYPDRLDISKNDGPLSLAETTIAEALDKIGEKYGVDYKSCFIGKWHLSFNKGPSDSEEYAKYYPHNQGFDETYGSSWIGGLQAGYFPGSVNNPYFEGSYSAGGWNATYTTASEQTVKYFPNLGDPKPDDANEFLDDSLTTRAVEFIQNNADNESPFFLYMSFYSVHAPIPDGLDEEGFTCGDSTDPRHTNAYYANMIKRMDHNIGRIVKEIENQGLTGNTIIIFTSDNGAREEHVLDDDAKCSGSTDKISDNEPLKGEKHNYTEGGIRVPMIVAGLGIDVGGTCHIPVHGIDIFPTILEMAFPERYGTSITPGNDFKIDGESFVPLLENPDVETLDNWNRKIYSVSNSANYHTMIKKNPDASNSLLKMYYYHKDGETDETKETTLSWPDIKVNSSNNEVYGNSTSSDIENWLDDEFKVNIGTATYDTISIALTNASKGDIIEVPPKTFKGEGDNIEIDKNITLTSQAPEDPATVAATIIEGKCSDSVIEINNATVTIEGITISGGKAANGGGIGGNGYNLTIKNCNICNNTASSAGGGIHNFNGTSDNYATIENCKFYNNIAVGGGAIAKAGQYTSLINCLIYGNSAATGGAINNIAGDIVNCTIVDNIATGTNLDTYHGGGGIRCATSSYQPNVTNSILWGNRDNDSNTATEQEQLYNSGAGTTAFTVTNSCIGGNTSYTGANNIDEDPSFKNAPPFVDIASDTSLDLDKLVVADMTKYSTGNIVEINNDGIRRTIEKYDGVILDGTGDHIDTDYVLNPSAGSFSAFCWIYLEQDAENAYQTIIQQEDGTGTGRTWLYRNSSDGKLCSYLGGLSTCSDSALDLKKWYHVGLDYDGVNGLLKLYVDNVEVASETRTMETCDGSLLFGEHKNVNSTNVNWHGMIHDITISQNGGVVAHWELDETSGSTAYDSVGTYNGTLAGDAAWTTSLKFCPGMYLDPVQGGDMIYNWGPGAHSVEENYELVTLHYKKYEELNNQDGNAFLPNLTDDGLTIYFVRYDSEVGHNWIYEATRQDLLSAFSISNETKLTGLSTGSSLNIAGPWISNDEQRLYYHEKLSGEIARIKVAIKDGDSAWQHNSTYDTYFNAINTTGNNAGSCSLTDDELIIVFQSNREVEGVYEGVNLWMATRSASDSAFGTPTLIAKVNSATHSAYNPRISGDGLELYFSSNHEDNGYKIYRATRPAITNDFGDPKRVAEVPQYNNCGSPFLLNSTNELFLCPYATGIYSVKLDKSPCIDAGENTDASGNVDVDGNNRIIDGNLDESEDVDMGAYEFDPVNNATAHWKLDDASDLTASDSSGNGFDGELQGGTSWESPGKINGAARFDGTDDYIQASCVLDPSAGSFSVFCWVKGGGSTQGIISQWNGTTGGVWLNTNSSGCLTTTIKSGTVNLVSNYSGHTTDGNWHHLGLIWDAVAQKRYLYADGNIVASDDTSIGNLISSDNPIIIGAHKTDSGFWNGLIDDVRIYNRVLSFHEISVLLSMGQIN